jgi:NAD(P) transhydrogenase subunit alpha
MLAGVGACEDEANMNIVALNESVVGERRCALTPQAVEKLLRLGARVSVEPGLGVLAGHGDEEFVRAGAELGSDRENLLRGADLLLTVRPPGVDVVAALRESACVAGFLDPFFAPELVETLASRGLSSLCMELVPRTTYAQKMDALSSQASLAGYAAVVLAAERSAKAFPMMSTPAGTIAPARVFVIGAGVAGLQAIATAKRLGARVEAYDTRPVVKEQVQSLGARFLEIDVGETGQTEQGYARELTAEQLESQRKQMAKACANSDVIVSTAQVFGRRAPRIIDEAMVAGMRSGAVIVDMAAATGGNVAGSKPGEEVLTGNGVLIIGADDLPARVARDASQVYSNNLYLLIEHAWDKETAALRLDPQDAVVGACLLTAGGEVRDERVKAALGVNR